MGGAAVTNEQLLKLKTDYAAWAEPGDDLDLSEVTSDVTMLVDELLVARKRAEVAEAERDELRALIAFIDKNTPRADATCIKPGIKFSTAARRMMKEEAQGVQA
jgi:hypothetical protein